MHWLKRAFFDLPFKLRICCPPNSVPSLRLCLCRWPTVASRLWRH